MFYEWVSDGAIFGIKAFFAIMSFALCAGVILMVLCLIGSVIRELDNNGESKKRRPY